MKTIIINDNGLTLDEIDYEVIRVKAIIINSNGKILLVHNNNTYQFPGGHHKKNENLRDTLARELREELGVDVEIPDEEPFLMLTTYDSNYFGTGSKVCNKIYYFVLYRDIEPNLNNLDLDELESKTEFSVLEIDKTKIIPFLNNALEDGKIENSIGREMLIVSNEFNELLEVI